MPKTRFSVRLSVFILCFCFGCSHDISPAFTPTIAIPQNTSVLQATPPAIAPTTTPDLQETDEAKIIGGAGLPPTGSVDRKYPKLVNYFTYSFAENRVNFREERLAQWDVLIIPNGLDRMSLSKIRSVNPRMIILAFVPFGQEPGNMDYHAGIPDESDPNNWFGKTVGGEYIKFTWGGHMMNPYKRNYAYPKHVSAFIKEHYIDSGLYDGVMFDIVTEWVPTFASPDDPPTFDVDEDGDFDDADRVHYVEGMTYLLKTMRELCPGMIITGNGGTPWSKYAPYFQYANGNMHENALGDELGTYYWNANYGEWYPADQPWMKGMYGTWDGFRTALDSANPYHLPRYHFISADVRMNRSQEEAQTLSTLTDDDLRRMRLGLVTSMLDDGGYFGFDRGDYLHGQLWWFDEYDADPGDPVEEYRIGAFGDGSGKNEVYSRKFQNGVVILNNNPADIVVQLGASYRDATTKITNTTFTIPAFDARIFIRI
jgi:hypothetical protein